jgi:hypothetical protein
MAFSPFPVSDMQHNTYLKIVRASAWYDLLVTWPFATPWTFAWLYASLAATAQSLALPGTVHPLDATHMMLANLLGSVVVVWSLARIGSPSLQMGRLDGLARLLFAAWQVNAVLSGASVIVLAFTVFELAFGLLQFMPVRGAPLRQS